MPTDYLIGLDLGQANDFSALGVLERTMVPDDGGREESRYAVRHLERFRLRTPYPLVCSRVVGLVKQAPLSGGMLVVDYTGVGRPVIDALRAADLQAQLCPVTITSGLRASRGEDGDWHVPKNELVGLLQTLLQSRRLAIAATLPEARTLVREMLNFQERITAAAHKKFGAWRRGTHDDLVLALAIAVWCGERGI